MVYTSSSQRQRIAICEQSGGCGGKGGCDRESGRMPRGLGKGRSCTEFACATGIRQAQAERGAGTTQAALGWIRHRRWTTVEVRLAMRLMPGIASTPRTPANRAVNAANGPACSTKTCAFAPCCLPSFSTAPFLAAWRLTLRPSSAPN